MGKCPASHVWWPEGNDSDGFFSSFFPSKVKNCANRSRLRPPIIGVIVPSLPLLACSKGPNSLPFGPRGRGTPNALHHWALEGGGNFLDPQMGISWERSRTNNMVFIGSSPMFRLTRISSSHDIHDANDVCFQDFFEQKIEPRFILHFKWCSTHQKKWEYQDSWENCPWNAWKNIGKSWEVQVLEGNRPASFNDEDSYGSNNPCSLAFTSNILDLSQDIPHDIPIIYGNKYIYIYIQI